MTWNILISFSVHHLPLMVKNSKLCLLVFHEKKKGTGDNLVKCRNWKCSQGKTCYFHVLTMVFTQ